LAGQTECRNLEQFWQFSVKGMILRRDFWGVIFGAIFKKTRQPHGRRKEKI
jgi:hypothetical protein